MPSVEFTQRFLEALKQLDDETFDLTIQHAPHGHEDPSMSGLGSCALQQWLTITGAPETDPRDPMGYWTTMMGRHGQAISAKVLETMGYEVFDQEKEVNLADDLIVGHIDGKLTGLDLGNRVAIWDAKVKGVWSMYGTKKSYGLAVTGLPAADQGIFLQLQAYIEAENADLGIVTAHPADISAARIQASIKKVPIAPVYRIVLERDPEAAQLAITRGKLIAVAVKTQSQPAREFDPYEGEFPCSYCSWMSWCKVYGRNAQMVLPEIPLNWRHPVVDIEEVA
jgi:hypothetical protein